MTKCVVCGGHQFQSLFSHKGGNMGKCRGCGLVQLVPMPSAGEIAKLYHEDFDHFTPYIEQLSVHRAYFREKINDILLRVGGLRMTNNGLRLLDIGCAIGVLLEEAQKQGIEAVGIDISKDAVAYCKKKGLIAYAGTVTSFARPGLAKLNSFDVVTAFQVIEHERDPLDAVRGMKELLVKGGLVVIATPNASGMWARIMGRRWFGYAHPEHVVLFDPGSMRTLLSKAGFGDIHIRSDSPRPFPLSFAFTRAADYFPFLAWIFKPVGKLLDRFDIKNPINPWDDMIVYARK